MSPDRVWTAEQRSAIERRTGDMLLDAGAGSGKTAVLVERFVRAVLEDGIDVSAILTITFTEKAAAELRDRIRTRLRDCGAFAAARDTEGAYISTIHGFCARILRTGALAAGLDPAFTVLDRDDSEPLAEAAFESALRDLGRAGPAAVALIADYGAGVLQSTICSVHAQLRARGEQVPRLPAVAPVALAPARAVLGGAARALMIELAAIPEPGVRVSEALTRVERALVLAEPEPEPEPGPGRGSAPSARAGIWPAELDRLGLPGNGSAPASDARAAYGEALSAFRSACAAEAAGPVRELLDRLLVAFGERYAERKREASGVDFEDLELLARDLLRDRPELRAQYAERFERIMVDELQDTNSVQLELIESLARENLFTVGDAQQSIYGFRHADVTLFEQRGERLSERGARATLGTNFRSRPEILAALGTAFADQLGARFRPLAAGRAGAEMSAEVPAAEPRVELLLVDKGAEWELEGMAAPWRLAEANALAERIAALVAAGTAPGEVVVLMRASTDMRAYERALERHGLPTYVIGGRGYWSHPQVLDLVAYLAVLANPRDEEALYTTLTSPLIGASTDALVILAGTARSAGRDPWALLRETGGALDGCSAADRGALAAASAWLPEERVRALRGGIDGLIDRALQRSGYDLGMLALPGGRRRLANVRKLMRLGREFEHSHGPDLRGFLRLAGERAAGRAGSSREAEAPIEGDGLDAVRLMTIHRAKGLEFETVCVADLGRSVRPRYEMLRVGADGRLGLRLARSGMAKRVPALAFEALGLEAREAEEREERRLYYVAMTRARERLILSGATRFEGWTGSGSNGGGAVAWIAPAFVAELGARIAEGGGVVSTGGVAVELILAGPAGPAAADTPPSTAVLAPTAGAEPAEPAESLPALPPSEPPPPVSRLSYSALGEYARCGYRFYAERVLGLPARVRGADGRGGATAPRSATDRGVLLHALLERLRFDRPVAPDVGAVQAAARAAGLRPAPGAGEAAELSALIERFVGSELCARLGRAGEPRREERFAFPLAVGVLITGTIDVLALEPAGRMLIVDYKSDQLAGGDPEAIVQRAYGPQRLLYALAALHAGASVVEVVHCFLERPEAPASEVYEQDRRPELEAELATLAGGVLRRAFPVSGAPHRALCAGCPAEDGLCSWPEAMTRRETPDRLF